jgi:hypothetical protein
MKEVTFLDSYNNKFKSISDIRDVLISVKDKIFRQLAINHVLATGDYHVYRNLLRAVWCRPGFENVVPIPGAFHIALNAQEALFEWFRPLFLRLWTAAYPKKKFPTPVPPLTRKTFLELLSRVWADTGERCMRHMRKLKEWPAEFVLLRNLFAELIPLSLDIYTVFLMGNFDQYEMMLYRAALLFAQLGKVHYVQCIFTFVATVEHWRRNRPDFFAVSGEVQISQRRAGRDFPQHYIEIWRTGSYVRIVGKSDSILCGDSTNTE